jgi:phosphoenolpyruvate carboxykinase (GTP)
MALRVYNDLDAIKTPTGYIPKYEDLEKIFMEVLNKKYSQQDYISQFTLRIPQNLAKIERIVNIYKTRVLDTPNILFEVLKAQKKRLEDCRRIYGDYVSPLRLVNGS